MDKRVIRFGKYIIRHISIFIFEITNCDLKRVVTYDYMQR